ncbi:MAG: putative transposon Tn552 DNA-invertase bin3 [Pelotomaculum sp. PtaB.Bin013]|uniref:Recombinase family protein n=1 Tax=Pelotomaculum isophthalicicum JI TaxID=947010 RepID=A0A9X4H044_9FIRM|nr:recombinase family protein [Pelotomaculum isophthalicicum]MDF9409502.1 recombinase family protein [Pelotomaculum isophthalicicum JI]OPX92200.1 MAG: putative transposon Tn552 DNA-invertase bin3 [Pelotomaculum sp. PtaB.Bin013]
MNIGYVRVSSKDQNEERQVLKMRELGIEDRFLFIDKASGKDFDRPEYQAMKRIVRGGDVIYLDALDRLGRDYDGIIREWKEITREIGADIVVLENENIFDSRKFREMGDIGKLMEDQFLSLLSYVAEQERKKIKQRQREGISVARANGKRLGRPGCVIPPNFQEICQQWREGKMTAVEAMRRTGMKKSSFYKMVKILTI